MNSESGEFNALCLRLRRISREVDQMAGLMFAVQEMDSAEPHADLRHEAIDKLLQYAREQYGLRRKRSDFLPRNIFAEPAWDILLDLFISERTGRVVSVTSACLASGVPMTTALRAISVLEAKRLVERHRDRTDRRRYHLILSERGYQSMCALLEHQLNSKRAS